MASLGANALITRAMRMETKLRSALEATVLEIDDVSHKHAGHAAVKDSNSVETHFDLKIVSPKFEGKNLVNRHRMVYQVLSDELNSGLHALSIVAKTPQEAALNVPTPRDGSRRKLTPPTLPKPKSDKQLAK